MTIELFDSLLNQKLYFQSFWPKANDIDSIDIRSINGDRWIPIFLYGRLPKKLSNWNSYQSCYPRSSVLSPNTEPKLKHLEKWSFSSIKSKKSFLDKIFR